MNNELKEMGKQLKEILDKYPNRQKEILFYIFGEDTIRKIINKPTIFIDTQDMEERYGEQLYQEYLEKENKELKAKVNQLETNRDEAIEILKLCNSQCSKEAISKLERGKE